MSKLDPETSFAKLDGKVERHAYNCCVTYLQRYRPHIVNDPEERHDVFRILRHQIGNGSSIGFAVHLLTLVRRMLFCMFRCCGSLAMTKARWTEWEGFAIYDTLYGSFEVNSHHVDDVGGWLRQGALSQWCQENQHSNEPAVRHQVTPCDKVNSIIHVSAWISNWSVSCSTIHPCTSSLSLCHKVHHERYSKWPYEGSGIAEQSENTTKDRLSPVCLHVCSPQGLRRYGTTVDEEFVIVIATSVFLAQIS